MGGAHVLRRGLVSVISLIAIALAVSAGFVASGWWLTPADAQQFETGELNGTIEWDGTAVPLQLANAPCGLKVTADGANDSTTNMTAARTYNFPALATGSYTPRVYTSSNVLLGSGTPISVAPGTNTRNVDLMGSTSLVTGTVTVGGSPVANAYMEVNSGGICTVADANGNFALLLPTGSYGMNVRTAQGQTVIGALYFSVTSGIAQPLGTVEAQPVTTQDATVQGTLRVSGQPFTPVGAHCSLSAGLSNTASGVPVAADGTFTLNTNGSSVQINAGMIDVPGFSAYHYGASATVGLAAGVITTALLEAEQSPHFSGVAIGTLTLNGAPFAGGKLTLDLGTQFGTLPNVGCVYTDANGNFKLLLPDLNGLYTVRLRASDDTVLGTFSVDATPGVVIDLGAQNFEVSSLDGQLSWDGTGLPTQLANAPCGLKVTADGANDSTTNMTAAGTYNFPALATGSYTPRVYTSSNVLLGSGTPISVAPGTNTRNVDLMGSTSLVTGTVTVGGSPVANAYMEVNSGGICTVADANGNFALLLPAGSYGMNVRTAQGQPVIGALYFSVMSGIAQPLGTVEAQPVTTQDATIQGTLRFNGQPFTPVGAACSLAAGPSNGSSSVPVAQEGTFTVTGLGGSSMEVTAGMVDYASFGLYHQGAAANVGLAPGVTSTTLLESEQSPFFSGLAIGRLQVNGAPFADGRLTFSLFIAPLGELPAGCANTDAAGNFKLLLPETSGVYVVRLRAADNTAIGSFVVDPAPGSTHDLGSQNFLFTGTLGGAIDWDGTAVPAPLANSPCGLKVTADGDNDSTTNVTPAGTYNFPALATGSYTPRVYTSSNVLLGSGASISVAPGLNTRNVDLAGSTSLVTGTVTVGGSPVANAYMEVNSGGICTVADANGNFALLLPTGSYGVGVRTAQGQPVIGALYFDVTTGVPKPLGSVEAQPVTTQDATIQGTLRFNGQPFTPVGAPCSLSAGLYNTASGVPVAANGTFTLNTNGSSAQINAGMVDFPGFSAYHYGGSATVGLAAGVTTTALLEAEQSPHFSGVAIGTLTLNGAPFADGRLTYGLTFPPFGELPAGCANTDANGSFKLLLPDLNGGLYTVRLRASDDTVLGTFTVDATPGVVIDVGSQYAQEFVVAANGATVETGTTPTSSDNTTSQVVVPAGAAPADFTLSIAETSQPTSTAGYGILGQQIVIEPEGITFSAPVTITFTFDASIVGALPAEDVPIFRNGVLVPDCVVPETYPCVSSRASVAGGDVEVVVLTTQFSVWQSGVANADGDACTDFEELGAVPAVGGMRNPNSVHDFYDVNGSKRIDAVDIGLVRANFNPAGPVPAEDVIYDRRLGVATWAPGPPDNKINAVDIGLVRASFNHSCQGAP
jgi:hypothetical protein